MARSPDACRHITGSTAAWGVNHEEWNNAAAVLVRNRIATIVRFPAKQRSYDRYREQGDCARDDKRCVFDHVSPNLTPARANPPAMPIGVPSARQQAAPDIVPSS
jgi:hypothetical protein